MQNFKKLLLTFIMKKHLELRNFYLHFYGIYTLRNFEQYLFNIILVTRNLRL